MNAMSDTQAGWIIGLLTGLLFVIVGSFLQRSWEHRKWLRERRQEIYSEAALELERAASLAMEFRDTVRDHGPLGKARIEPFLDQLDAQNDVLEKLDLRMQVIASRRMRQATDKCFYSNECTWWLRRQSAALSFEKFPADQILYNEDVRWFVDEARKDLGAETIGDRMADVRTAVGYRVRYQWARLRRVRQGRQPPQDPAAINEDVAPARK